MYFVCRINPVLFISLCIPCGETQSTRTLSTGLGELVQLTGEIGLLGSSLTWAEVRR